jgi:hypothetical protein
MPSPPKGNSRLNNQLLVFVGSLAGIAVMVLVAFGLGLGRNARIADEAEARELAGHAIYGFDSGEAVLDASGRGALLRDANDRILLLAPHGAHFTAELIEPGIPVQREGNRLTIAGTALDLGEAAGAWEMRVNALNS